MQPTRLPSPPWRLPPPGGLPRYTRGRVVMIGDAAHGFLPTMGQGVAMALADGLCVRRATYWPTRSGGWLTSCCLDWFRCDAPTSRQSAGARLAALGADRFSSRRGTATNSAQLTNAADPTQLA